MSNKTMLGDASGRGAVDGFRVTCPAMQHPYTEAEIDAVVKVMREACGQTQGKYMVEFEQAFCAFTGAKHAFAVNNCTSALKMAAIFCHIQPGDEVIIPAYTFCASAIPFGDLGAKIVRVRTDEKKRCERNCSQRLERVTRLELATSTLARWRSTG